MPKINRYISRPYEQCITQYLDETTFDALSWREVALSLMGYMSDDSVRDWAESEGYGDVFEDEEDEKNDQE